MARPLTTNSLPWKKLVEIHRTRNPHRGEQRINAEVRNFLRRGFGLGPDAREPEDGGLEGLTTDNAADAFLLVIRNTTDITQLYPEKEQA